MKRTLIVFSVATVAALLALAAADPAFARKKVKHRCVDKPAEYSWNFLAFGGPKPHGNGCAPAVYSGGDYVGQDPDPSIRHQLGRDPATGYQMNYQ